LGTFNTGEFIADPHIKKAAGKPLLFGASVKGIYNGLFGSQKDRGAMVNGLLIDE
jgi:hypothetical protein